MISYFIGEAARAARGGWLKRMGAMALIASTSALIGCGDSTSATGQEGRIDYTLYTRYVSPESDLRNVSIITGYDQRIDTDLTSKGRQDAETPQSIQHTIAPAEGAVITPLADGSDVTDFFVNVTTPGTYDITSTFAGNLFDRITLQFDTPTEIELVTWLREATGDFSRQPAQSSYSVTEGAQVTFLPIPTSASGERLLGDIAFDVTVSPSTSAVAVHNVEAVYEQNVIYQESPLSLVFIEPGTVTISVRDQVHTDVVNELVFEVAPIVAE